MTFILPKENTNTQDPPTNFLGLKLPKSTEDKNAFNTSQFGDETIETKFDFGALPGMDKEELRAQRQSNLDRIGDAIPRLVSKVGTEIAKTPAYLYAVGEAGLTDKTLAESLDNAWLNTLQNLDDNVKKEFAIHTPNSVKNGDLWDNLTSTSFWTNEGVDGAGFLISMMVPGAALKSVGIAGKLSKLGATANLAKNVELGSMTLLNTTLESAAEAKGLVDGLKPQLQQLVISGEVNPKTGQPWNDEDVKQALGEAGQSSFLMNMALLAGPNFIMNKNLLGRFTPTKNTLNKVVDDAGNFVNLSQVTKKQIAGEYAKQIGEGLFSEGFVEEAGQFAIEDYNKKLAKGETTDGLLVGLLDSYANALTTTEGQKSIFLGGLFGSTAALGGVKQMKAEREYSTNLSKVLKDNFDGYSASVDDIYQKDTNGKVVLDETNKPVVNYKKAAQAIYNLALENKDSQIKDVYALAGNKEAYDYITNNEFTRFALSYLREDGGLQVLEKHIDLLSDKLVQEKKQKEGIDDSFDEAKYKTELKQKAQKLQKTYDSVNNFVDNINLPITAENQEQAGEFLNKLKNSAFQETSKQFFMSDRINALGLESAQLQMGSAAALPQVQEEVKKITEQIESYQKALNESIDNYKLIFDPKEQVKAFNDFLKSDQIKDKAIIDATEKVNSDFAKSEEDRKPLFDDGETKVEETPTTYSTYSDEALQEAVKTHTGKTDSESEHFLAEAQKEVKVRGDKFLPTINNATNPKELDAIVDQIDSKGLMNPELVDKIASKRESLKSTTVSTNKENTINESREANNTPSRVLDAPFDLQGKLAQTWKKSAAGRDNDSKAPEQRYFRFLEHNELVEGTRFEVVTKKNNKELFDKLFDADAKAYEEEHKTETIYVVFTDKNNKHILVNQDGTPSEKGELVYATLLTEVGIDDTGIKDKETAKQELNTFRTELLEQTKPVHLAITNKSKGIRVREKNDNGSRKFNPVQGFITSNLNKEGLLQIPTIVLDDKGTTELKNGQPATAGKLYAFLDETGEGVDLFARNLTNDEAIVVTVLIAQRMGIAPKTVEDTSEELDKLIYFGVPKSGPNEYTLGIKDNILYIGEKSFTKDQLATEEAATYLENFLLNFKYANANAKFEFREEFNEPVFNDATGNIDYKKWNSYQEFLLYNENGRVPLFGTDVPAIGQPKFRNYYVTYEPTIISGDISVSENEVKSDSTSTESTDTEVKIEHKTKAETKTFKKRGNGGTIKLDRLETILRNPTKELGQDEKEWFKTNFPGVPVEDIKGLIDNNSFGRFISSGKVLLSNEAPENTLRHEAFHVVTQLYLTPKEIKSIYSETRTRYKNKELTDLEVEEILAEDFANYKDTGKVLGGREATQSIFQRLLAFIKNLVGLNNTQIRDIYNNIETGKYLNKQIIGNNQFRTLDKSLPTKTEEFTKQTLDGVDYEFFNVLFKNGFTPEKLFQVTSLTTKIYNEVYDTFFDRLEVAKVVGNTKAIENYEYILENWDTKGGVLDLHNARIKSLGISLTKGENEKTGEIEPGEVLVEDPNLITEESIVEDENNETRSGEAYQNANAISTKDVMFKQTKLFIRTLPKVDSNGDLILNDLGLPQLVDFNTTYNFLLRNLAGVSDYPSMLVKLEELSKNKPEFKVLMGRLGSSSDTLNFDQIMFQNQFRQDFDKNQAISYKTMLRADGTIYLIDATRENTSGKVKEIWRNKLPDLIKLNDEGKLVTDATYLKSKDNIEFLSKIGITFSKETLPALESNEKFSNAVLGIKKYISDNKYDLTNLYNDKSDAKGNLNTIVDLEAKYTPDVTELSFISTEGKTVYSISLNNGLSIIKNIINNSKTKTELFSKLPHLDTVNTKNSLWLKTMFDSNGNKKANVNVNLDLLDGLATQDLSSKVQKQTTKLSKGDKLVQELNNLLLDGKTAYIRASDKSTEHALTLSNYGKGEKLPVSIASLKDGVDVLKLKDTFRGYFKDELQSIVESALFNKGKDLDVYRDITEWNKDNTSVKIKWRLFSDFPNSDEVKAAVRTKIEELKVADLSDNEKQNQIDTLFTELQPSIDAMTIEFFDKYTKELIREYESVGITEQNKLGLSKELTEKYSYEQIMRALAVNDFINSIEQVKLFVGDLAFYKDLFKRTSAFTGTKKTVRVDNDINTWLNINAKRKDGKKSDGKINVFVYQDSNQSSNYFSEYVDALLASGLSKEQAETILYAYTDMDEADAQGYITLDEYKEFFVRTGDWKAEHERIFNKSQNGETLTKDEIFYFMPIKAQYAGPQDYNGVYAPAYHKYSLMPLIPQMVKGTNLEKLLDNMTKNEVGYSVFKSGSKVGTKVDTKGKANKFYTDVNNGEINSENLLKQVIDYKFLGIQLDIAPKLKKEVIFGTQFRKLLFSNLFEGGKEKMPNAQKLFNEYTNIFDKLIEVEKEKLIKELGVNPLTYKQEDVKKLVELLREEAKGRNLADNIIDALQTEEIEGKIMLKYNFDYMVNKAKIDSMIMSVVNSRLIRQMMNGDAMIQGASTGFEKEGRRKEGSNDLKFYRKDKDGKTLPMEVKVPLTGEYRTLLDKYETIDGVNKALKSGEIDKNLITLIGYRIPTQGLNSIEFMEIQEFLPESSGNLIVLPTEIVAKSGGDYDIDKMNIFRPWFNAKDESQKLQNKIIDISKEILEHESNFNALITPNSTKILTTIVDELRFIEFKEKHPDTKLTVADYTKKYKEELKNIRYTNQLKLTTKVDQFTKFLGGKAGVGIGALQNTHHILSQIANLNLNRKYINDKGEEEYVTIYFPHNILDNRNIDLSKLKDVKGNNNISEVISQVINASVDIAKDPFMFDLNMNLETLSTYLYLVRTGVEFEQIAYFMKQPIITQFLNESSKNKSVFLKVSGKAKKDGQLIKDIITEYEQKLKAKLKIKSEEEFIAYMDEAGSRYDITTSELKSYLSKSNQDSVAYLHAQIQLLDNYKDYKKQANLLSEAINSVNHDTAGLGASINASRNKIDQKAKVKKTNFINNMDNIYKNTFVGKFDQHQFTIDAYSQFYSTQQGKIVDSNRNLLDNLTSAFTKETDKNKLNTLIDNDFINFVVQNYGYEDEISTIINNLFKGDNSVAKQILRLRTADDLSDEEQILADNLLIKELYPLLAEKGHLTTDNIKIYAKRFDTFTSNQLTESFRQIQDRDPKLAKDLMDLGILQSGLNNSAITYMGIIPFEYYGDLVKGAFESFDKKNGAEDLEKFNQLFIRNNSSNPTFGMMAYKRFLRENPANALGDGIYGKTYDLNLYTDALPTIKLEDKPVEDILDESTQIEDYSPEVIDNSEDNLKDYPEDLDNSENVTTFDRLISKELTLIKSIPYGKKKFKNTPYQVVTEKEIPATGVIKVEYNKISNDFSLYAYEVIPTSSNDEEGLLGNKGSYIDSNSSINRYGNIEEDPEFMPDYDWLLIKNDLSLSEIKNIILSTKEGNNSKSLNNLKVRGPIRADSLSELKKEIGLRKSEVAGENRAKILGKLKKFNTKNNTNYSVQFKRLGESTLYTFTITGGPVIVQAELDFVEKPAQLTMTQSEYSKMLNDIETSDFSAEEKASLTKELNEAKTDEEIGEVIKKFCK